MGAGQYAKIVGLNALAFNPNFYDVTCSLIIQNTSSVPAYLMGAITYEYGGHLYPVIYDQATYGVVDPGLTLVLTAHFTMPDQDVIVHGYSLYQASDNQWYPDGQVDAHVKLENQNTIPSDYNYERRVLYPAATTYDGYFEVGTIKFTAPLTMLPGVTWIVDKLLGAYVSACQSNGADPLEMRIFSKPAQIGSTDYIVQFVCTSASVGHSVRGVGAMVGVGVLAMAAILLALSIVLVGVIGLAIIGETRELTKYRYGPQVTTTTTTQPTTKSLTSGQSFTNTSPVVITDGGGGDTITTDSSGNKTKLSPGQTMNIPAGSTTVAGSGGMTITIPAGTTTTTGPSNPQGPDTVGNIVKYAAIGVGILVVGVVVIAAMQAFGKREVYRIPVKT